MSDLGNFSEQGKDRNFYLSEVWLTLLPGMIVLLDPKWTRTFTLKQGIGIESLRLSGKEKFMIQSEEVSCGLQVFAALELVEV